MVLGCMFALLTEEINSDSRHNYFKAIQYINEAEYIQRKLIDQIKSERGNPRSRFFQIDTH